jgi:uncharacterized protein
MTHTINSEELKKILATGESVTLLDVRRKTDYQSEPRIISGAKWRDPEKIELWMKQLSPADRTVVYCVKGGSVSRGVTDRLQQEGFNVVFLEGGLKTWIESGNPVQEIQTSSDPYRIKAADIELLRKSGVSESDIIHSVKVAEKALEIASRMKRKLDLEFVGRGALFHDLGKAKTHEIEHGKLGAQMGMKLGLPDAITAVMEKHIRGGLSPEEAVELSLPVKDYSLKSLEERIIIYADRLVDIITDGIVSIREEKEAEDRFEEILRNFPKYGKNEKTLMRYLGYHSEIQDLVNQ